MSLFNMVLGGGSGGEIKSIEATPSTSSQLQFQGIAKEPSWWHLLAGGTTGSSSYYWLISFGSEDVDNASYINTSGNIINSSNVPAYQIQSGDSFLFSRTGSNLYKFDTSSTYTLFYIE